MIVHRDFDSYDAYVHVQGHKARTEREALLAGVPVSVRHFERVFRTAAPHLPTGRMLCLGARTGAEVTGAVKAGFTKSVGIDLHPISPNVQQADWHDLPFPEASFPVIFTNSLDHCLHLDRLVSEVRRVLTPDGRFYVMASDRGGKTPERWLKSTRSLEALYWQQADDLCAAICALGMVKVTSWRSSFWSHYVLRRA